MPSINTIIFAILFLVIYSQAVPEDTAPAPAITSTAAPGAGGNSTDSAASDDEVEEVLSEEAAVDKEIAEVWAKECLDLLGDCWLFYENTKAYLTEEHRLKICLKRIKGFAICSSVTEEQATKAKGEAEQREKEKEDAAMEKEHKDVERKKMLNDRKEDWDFRRKDVMGMLYVTETVTETEAPAES